MTDRAEMVTFFVFAVPLVFTALGVVIAKNPVYAAMNLVAAFFFMAGIYVILVAHLIAFLQILVYAGAVMVLFLFVIMLLSIGDEHLYRERKRAMQVIGVLGAVGVLVVLVGAIWQATGGVGQNPQSFAEWMGALFTAPTWSNVRADFGTVRAVGRILFTQFLLPFEATSLLLLVAIVGAVVVAKEKI